MQAGRLRAVVVANVSAGILPALWFAGFQPACSF
jgi:hypothetical protein